MKLLLLLPAVELGGKLAHIWLYPLQCGVQRPVFLRLKGPDLLLPLTDQPCCHRLDPAGGQTPADLLPQKRGDLIAHHPVQHPSRLLGVHQIHVQLPGGGDGLVDHLFGDLVEGDPEGLVARQPQQLLQMPGDGLPLPVRVGGQKDTLTLFSGLFQIGNDILFPLDGLVVHGEILLHIHADLALGQVPDMAHGGLDLIARSQIFGNGLGLGRRLHDHQIVLRFRRHSVVPPNVRLIDKTLLKQQGQTRPWPVFPLTDPERLFPVAFYPFLTLFYVLRAGFCPLFMESGSPTHRSVSPAFPPPCLSTEAWSAPKARAGQGSGPIPQYHRPSGFCAGYTKGYPARHR